MTYIGRVHEGKIIFEADFTLPEGTVVRVDAVDEQVDEASLSKAMSKLAGSVEGPDDGSINHDHYLYGIAKK